jgi:hypothetical protein
VTEVNGQEIKNNLKVTYGLLPPEFRESKTYKRNSKITTKKTMQGDPPTMGSVTAHSLAQD